MPLPATQAGSVPTWLVYAVTVATGGLTWFITKFQIGAVPLEVSLVYRFAIAAVALMLVAIRLRISMRFGIADHFRIAVMGIFIFFGSFSLIYLALSQLTSGLVALLFSMVLLLNLVNNALLSGRALEFRVLCGAILGISGLMTVFWPEVVRLDLASGRTTAIMEMLGAATLFSFGNMISARLQTRGIPVLPSTGLAMGYGAISLALFTGASGTPFLFDFSLTYILSLIYLAFVGSVIGYVTYFIVVGRVGPERAAYSLVLTPALALTISMLYEDFTWTGQGLFGIALVLIGNVTVLTRPEFFRGRIRPAE